MWQAFSQIDLPCEGVKIEIPRVGKDARWRYVSELIEQRAKLTARADVSPIHLARVVPEGNCATASAGRAENDVSVCRHESGLVRG